MNLLSSGNLGIASRWNFHHAFTTSIICSNGAIFFKRFLIVFTFHAIYQSSDLDSLWYEGAKLIILCSRKEMNSTPGLQFIVYMPLHKDMGDAA